MYNTAKKESKLYFVEVMCLFIFHRRRTVFKDITCKTVRAKTAMHGWRNMETCYCFTAISLLYALAIFFQILCRQSKMKLKLNLRKLSPLWVLRVNKPAAYFQLALMDSLGTTLLTFPPHAWWGELNLELKGFSNCWFVCWAIWISVSKSLERPLVLQTYKCTRSGVYDVWWSSVTGVCLGDEQIIVGA